MTVVLIYKLIMMAKKLQLFPLKRINNKSDIDCSSNL
jgi:hypothetical protein